MLQEMDNEAQDLLNFLEGLECKRSTHTLELTSKEFEDQENNNNNSDEDSTTQQIRTSLAERKKFYEQMDILSGEEGDMEQEFSSGHESAVVIQSSQDNSIYV